MHPHWMPAEFIRGSVTATIGIFHAPERRQIPEQLLQTLKSGAEGKYFYEIKIIYESISDMKLNDHLA